MNEDERQEFTDAVFDFLYDTGIYDFSDIHKKKIKTAVALTKAQFGMDPDRRKTIRDGIKKLRLAAKRTRKSNRRGGKK